MSGVVISFNIYYQMLYTTDDVISFEVIQITYSLPSLLNTTTVFDILCYHSLL